MCMSDCEEYVCVCLYVPDIGRWVNPAERWVAASRVHPMAIT